MGAKRGYMIEMDVNVNVNVNVLFAHKVTATIG